MIGQVPVHLETISPKQHSPAFCSSSVPMEGNRWGMRVPPRSEFQVEVILLKAALINKFSGTWYIIEQFLEDGDISWELLVAMIE